MPLPWRVEEYLSIYPGWSSGIFWSAGRPVHAELSPGHFRFSVAGEPIINLEASLDLLTGEWKAFWGEAGGWGGWFGGTGSRRFFFLPIAWHLSAPWKRSREFSFSAGFILKRIFAELERMYNHLSGIAGIALDVSFSFPATFAGILKNRFTDQTQSFVQAAI